MLKPKLELHPSKIMAAFLFFIHGGALGCTTLLALAWWAHIAFATLLIISFIFMYRHYVMLRGAKSVIRVREEKDVWCIQTRDGHVRHGYLRGDSVVTNLVVILNFSVDPKKYKIKTVSVLVFSDSVTANEFRRLKVRLLFLRKHH
jgi:hypothetical protein